VKNNTPNDVKSKPVNNSANTAVKKGPTMISTQLLAAQQPKPKAVLTPVDDIF
jgi:hypothetical protein